MLKFYFSKASSALAAHILLEEVGADYEAIEISIPDGAHQRADFLAISPKGRIPVLGTPQGIITENPAILEFIAATYPAAGCLPVGAFEQAQARSLATYLASTVHVARAHGHRGRRWAGAEAAIADMKSHAPGNMTACAALLEIDLPLSPWALGEQYTFCDPYLFLLAGWMAAVGLSLEGYPKLNAHHAAMLKRPATQRALALHYA